VNKQSIARKRRAHVLDGRLKEQFAAASVQVCGADAQLAQLFACHTHGDIVRSVQSSPIQAKSGQEWATEKAFGWCGEHSGLRCLKLVDDGRHCGGAAELHFPEPLLHLYEAHWYWTGYWAAWYERIGLHGTDYLQITVQREEGQDSTGQHRTEQDKASEDKGRDRTEYVAV